jgi:putative ABC transport system permease protein
MRLGERVYRRLLFCYPREFRDEYGPEMEFLFRERNQQEPRFLLWLDVLADIGTTAPRERLETLMRDLAYAIRIFRKDPGFAGMAILALALGIGVNSAMFSIIDSILLRNLPFKQPDRLAMIWQPAPKFKLGTQYIAASPADYLDWKTHNRSFEHLAGFASRRANLSTSSRPESVAETLVTGDFFSVFQTPPFAGAPIPDITRNEAANRVAVLSYRFWKNRFGGDRAVIGRSILLDGGKYTVLGVMPEHFHFPEGNEMPALYGFPPSTDIWVPIEYSNVKVHDRNNHTLLVIGRLRAGVTTAQAQAELESIQNGLARLYPKDDQNFGVLITPLTRVIAGSFRTELLLLFAAVGFVLLIACANVANLLLARATVRRREVAVRAALGAPSSRLYRQLLTESIFLSLLGAVGGIVLAIALLRLVLVFAPTTIPRLQQTSLDWRVVTFTIAISLVTGILFGVVPAFQLVSGSFTEGLREARGQAGAGGGKLRGILVVSEVALAMALLVGSGLALRSLRAVEAVNPGFQIREIITTSLVLPAAKYQDQSSRRKFFEQTLQRVVSVPGVDRAGLVSALPLSNNENLGELEVKGKSIPGEPVSAERRWASEGYFAALGIPLVAGRYFEPSDGNPGVRSAVVNEAVARRFFPRENPLGQQVKIGHDWLTIVGVIGDVHNSNLENTPPLQVYLYYGSGTPQAMSLVVRAPQRASQTIASIRRAIETVDPDQSIADLSTMEQHLNNSVSARRFGTTAIAIFGSLALLLTIVGLYSVVTYNVAQRSKEMGLRIALGAMRSDVLRLVLRDALSMTGTGIIAGTAIALFASRFAAGFVYGIPARDPITFGAIIMLLLAVTAVAAYIPARRAASTDPNVVLRHE